MKAFIIVFAMIFSQFALASGKYDVYEGVNLTGPITNTHYFNRPGDYRAVVCNMKDNATSFLTLRSYCDNYPNSMAQCPSLRQLNNLAIMLINTRQTEWRNDGLWVKVEGIERDHNKFGKKINYVNLANTNNQIVYGWVHTDYLCDFTYTY